MINFEKPTLALDTKKEYLLLSPTSTKRNLVQPTIMKNYNEATKKTQTLSKKFETMSYCRSPENSGIKATEGNYFSKYYKKSIILD